mmetsp:Transcript_36516/g.72732  ORF Transcript_36516/g.72732 Transcript_36516/m.72732 type:complete len:233 (+) Transcript_36516:954-1652(+)
MASHYMLLQSGRAAQSTMLTYHHPFTRCLGSVWPKSHPVPRVRLFRVCSLLSLLSFFLVFLVSFLLVRVLSPSASSSRSSVVSPSSSRSPYNPLALPFSLPPSSSRPLASSSCCSLRLPRPLNAGVAPTPESTPRASAIFFSRPSCCAPSSIAASSTRRKCSTSASRRPSLAWTCSARPSRAWVRPRSSSYRRCINSTSRRRPSVPSSSATPASSPTRSATSLSASRATCPT